ncbi:MAG: 30S ribosomal protein S4 [Clostridia bacterium]|jgi:small subunit ribosomal protein S4|nr:30S ribosomal protein S4 [Clostridia bacterium]
MAINKYHKLKRCRFLELDPAVIGCSKKSIRTSGRKGRKISEYGIQLREKQRAKFIYCVSEKQFRHYYDVADRMKGITGENMLSLLERRLDNVIFRMGVAATRLQARQLVSHAHFTVNGRKVDVPSYIVKAGDVIAVRENKKKNKYFEQIKTMKVVNMPKWLEFDPENLEGKVLALPAREDIDTQIEEHMIVELYSK